MTNTGMVVGPRKDQVATCGFDMQYVYAEGMAEYSICYLVSYFPRQLTVHSKVIKVQMKHRKVKYHTNMKGIQIEHLGL